MQQGYSFRRIFSRFFSKKALSHALASPTDSQQWDHLSAEQKREMADHYVAQGEIALLNDDLTALSHFEAAVALAPNDPNVWYREGLSFFDYGLTEDKEKALLVASRYFKFAAQIAPERFEIWFAWASNLFKLGAAYNEHHYYLEAKEKFQRSSHCSNIPQSLLAELYWKYGLVWSEIAQHSGEAVDVQMAIQAFQTSMNSQDAIAPEFLNDCGNAYLQMGLLINDSRLYLQAIEYLQRAVAIDRQYTDGWSSLASAYSQLYINTMNDLYVVQAGDCYARLCEKEPDNAEHWLGWAQLLGESGRQGRDARKLVQSIEKCLRCHEIDPNDPLLKSQWVESLSALGFLTGRLDLLIEAEEKILQATDQFPDDPDLWHAYGICMLAFGHYYEDPDYYEYAIEKLQFGLSLDRTHAEIWHALALAHQHIANLTRSLDMVDRATRFFARAMDLKPACSALMFDAANAAVLSCELHDEGKDLDFAITLYELLLQNQKEALLSHPDWLFRYAIALKWLGDFTDDDTQYVRALDLFTHVLLLDPETPQIHLYIGLCHMRLGEACEESDALRRAIYHYRLAMRQDEEDEEVWLECGIALIHLAQLLTDDESASCHADAEQKLLRAGQLGNIHAYYQLACLYSILARYEEAIQWLHKAQKEECLPSIEEMLDDEWLDNLRQTETFAQFLSNLETKG